MREIYYNLRSGISNIIYYFKTVWSTRSYDFGFCLDLFIKSLERLKHSIENDELHEWNYKDKRKLATVISLLKRVNDDDMEWYFRKQEELQDTFKIPKEYRSVVIEKGRMRSRISDFLSEKNYKLYKKVDLNTFKVYSKIKGQELDLAFNLIKKHSRKWWT